jgi:hypothetical protein
VNLYVFASLRGRDFVVSGNNPIDAYNNLVSHEADNGSMWKLGDSLRDKFAVDNEGFSYLVINALGKTVAYKKIG